MPGNLLALAPSASRGHGVGGVRAVQPVVRGRSDSQELPASRANSADTGKTQYTPSGTANTPALYNPSGSLGGGQSAFASVGVERSDSFDLAIRTTEGDVATIHLSEHQSASASAGGLQNAQASASGFSFSSTDEVQAQVSVQGNLNADETKAINALVKQVSGVAQDFFAGNTDLALADASKIDINQQGGTINALAFDLKTTQSVRAASTYQDVADSTGPLQVDVPTQAPPPPSTGTSSAKGSNSFLKNLQALLDGLTQGSKDSTPAASASAAASPVAAAPVPA